MLLEAAAGTMLPESWALTAVAATQRPKATAAVMVFGENVMMSLRAG
jgi:hypothetical protein